MYIASQKRKENVAEYLLYMWQIEDLIRALGLDIDRIQTEIIDKHTNLTDAQRKEMRDWYESLIDMMRRERVTEKGHLQINKNILLDLTRLHHKLLADDKNVKYNTEYYKTLPFIVEIRAKAGENKPEELEAAFNALYGLMLLRLQKKEISKETLEAAAQISRFLGMLAGYHLKEDEETEEQE